MFGSRAEVEDDALFVVRPHWKQLVRPVIVLFATVAATGFLVGLSPPNAARDWSRPAMLLAGLFVLVRWGVAPWLTWLGTLYAVAADRLTLRGGVLTHEVRVVPFARVVDVVVEQDSLIDRLLGAGTLVLVPTGDRERLELPGLPHVVRLQSELLVLVERAATGREKHATPADPEPL
ncbi:PH domain-containing protein [Embleya sp. NBC_00896]|uniref:PH domain-containing protein n=1 Tax=Embleya sp. NBC_00896 TaxID=2975961 RepID=UPI0038677FC2|nr:PH domain-containing protein [Embleya sp. NBC_00896]